MSKDRNNNKNKGSYYGKGRGRKGKGNNQSTMDNASPELNDNKEVHYGHPNDLSWYVTDPQLLKDVGRLQYAIPVGTPFSRMGKFITGTQEYDDAIPGICALHVMPTLGNAKHPRDAVNVAANAVYQFVRSSVSGSIPWDPNDLMIYFGAVDSLFTHIAYCTRAYATAFTYHQANKYTSEDLLLANRIDSDEFVRNLNNFRTRLNRLMLKVDTLYVPAILSIFQRHSWMFQNYYIEGDSVKDQIYMYVPEGYYTFGLDSDKAGKLFAHHYDDNMTSDDLIAIAERMIDPILADEDFNRISGRLLEAYKGNVLKLELLPDTIALQFVNNPEVLLQFKNAKCQTVLYSTASEADNFWNGFFDVSQSAAKDYLITNTNQEAINIIRVLARGDHNESIAVTSSSSAIMKDMMQHVWNEWSKDTLLTSPHPDVSEGENFINTRLTLAFDLEYNPSNTAGYTDVVNCYFGSEWPIKTELYARHRRRSNGQLGMAHYSFERSMILAKNDTEIQKTMKSILPIMSAFKYLPELAIITVTSDNPIVITSAGRSIFEVDNYALVSLDAISSLHDTSIMGEYNIPRIAISAT